jgi:hypothetical protein
LKAAEIMPLRVFLLVQPVVSHSITSPAKAATLARKVPEGLKATEPTNSLCPVKVFVLVQPVVSHSFTVESSIPRARKVPEGLKATDKTMSVNVAKVFCVQPVVSHSITS